MMMLRYPFPPELDAHEASFDEANNCYWENTEAEAEAEPVRRRSVLTLLAGAVAIAAFTLLIFGLGI